LNLKQVIFVFKLYNLRKRGLPAGCAGHANKIGIEIMTGKALEVVSKPQIRFKGKAQADR
jgi:hypothetical protein